MLQHFIPATYFGRYCFLNNIGYCRGAMKQLHKIRTVDVVKTLIAALCHIPAAFLNALMYEGIKFGFRNKQLVQNALNSVTFIKNNKVSLLNDLLQKQSPVSPHLRQSKSLRGGYHNRSYQCLALHSGHRTTIEKRAGVFPVSLYQ